MKKVVILLSLSVAILSYSPLFAVEVAPRISDREIIEGLAEARGDIKELRGEINGLRAEMNARFDAIDKRFEAIDTRFETIDTRFETIDARFEAVDKRFDDLHWTIRIFITIALAILGFVVNMQWKMNKKQAQMETSLETQKDELTFLKNLIEKLLPPRGVL